MQLKACCVREARGATPGGKKSIDDPALTALANFVEKSRAHIGSISQFFGREKQVAILLRLG
jgi:hypothetical protein